ncbi:MAG: cytochrome b/b6 domain-containing protein [Acidithiobacillus sp.]
MKNIPTEKPLEQNVQIWPQESRWLHAGIAFGVTWQLWSSLWMEPNWKQADYSTLSGALFSLHSWIGLMTALFILWEWLWIASNQRIRRRLFPWRGPFAPILVDLRLLLRGRLPATGPHSGLAGLVHGLGLLAITWMGLTGSVIFFFLPQSGTQPGPILNTLVPLHQGLAKVIWVYWIGHVGMTVLHALNHESIGRIFRLMD